MDSKRFIIIFFILVLSKPDLRLKLRLKVSWGSTALKKEFIGPNIFDWAKRVSLGSIMHFGLNRAHSAQNGSFMSNGIIEA